MIVERIRNLFAKEVRIEPSPEITSEIRMGYNEYRSSNARAYACYAPFKNVYFGHYGKVVACCYNRDHLLGTYPQKTIKEIWQGERAETLRANLKAYNFSKGCDGCMSQLVAGNFDGTKAKQYDDQRLNKNNFPSVLEFELDNTCNLECIMCSGDFSSLIRTKREGRPLLPNPYDDEFIRQLEEFIPYLEEVKFYGGEPFLIPVYYKIWDRIIALNPEVRISVQTNGTVLNTRVKEILQKTNVHINLSFDSLDKERYEQIRTNGNFEAVMNNLKYFHNYCRERGTFFGISACLMQNNWFEAPDFVRFCNELNAQLYFHTVFNPDFLSLKLYPQSKLEEIYNVLSAQYESLAEDTTIQKKNKKHYHDFILQLLEWSRKNDVNPETAGINTVGQFLDFATRKTFERKDIDETQKQAKAKKITENMRQLAAILPEGWSVNTLVRDLKTNDETAMITFLEAAESGSVKDAVEQLKLQSGAWIKNKK